MKDFRKRFLLPTFTFMVIACSNAPAVLAADAVVYRLKWLINMSTVGDIYALEKGYFAAEGLQVEIKPGGPEYDALRELELGRADFGVASADQIIHALEKGAPLVALAQLFQSNPQNWIYRDDRLHISSLNDLRGRTIGVTFGKNDEFIMRTVLADGGLNEKDVALYSVRLDYTPFYSGKVDLWPVYINSQGVEIGARLRQAGEKVAFFDPEKYGVRFVANSVVTSQRRWRENPERIRRFLRALLKGWRTALDSDNADEVLALVQRYDLDTTRANLAAQLAATRALVLRDDSVGRIDRAAWVQTERIMRAYGQIQGEVDVLKALQPIALP